MLPNDLFFVIHGTAAGIICGIQALVYERRHQTLSLLGQGICGMYGLTFSVAFILVLSRTIHLLDFLYVCSYIKLVVTVTKYVPQVSILKHQNRLDLEYLLACNMIPQVLFAIKLVQFKSDLH